MHNNKHNKVIYLCIYFWHNTSNYLIKIKIIFKV